MRRSTPYSSTTRSATAWTWGSSTPGQLAIYRSDLPGELRDAVEDVILNRRDDSTERLLELAEKYRGSKADDGANAQQAEWRTWEVEKNASNIRW